MASRTGSWFLVLGVAFLLAFITIRPTAARQPTPGSPDGSPSVDYALLNQPGPLWLPSLDFSGQNLYGVNLAGANLREVNFDNATLANADLSGALLVLATLRGADLTGANLRDATLSLADLRFANLPGVDFSEAQMPGVLLTGAALDRALLVGVDARESDMKHSSLRKADLSHALLAGTNLRGADLAGANLSHADLSSVNLAEANLSGANLDDIIFDAVTVWPANFDVETETVNGPLPSGEAGQQLGGSSLDRSDIQSLAIVMTLMPQLLPWFNQTARPQDGSLIDRAQDMALLDEMTVGSKMVVFKSVDVAEAVVPQVADKFDVIGYNLEHGPLNPLDEQADPVGSVVRMRTLADEYGLDLVLGPDHDFALSHGVELAPYVDGFAMQVQRVQSQPEKVREFVVPMAEAVRAANPAIKTSLQVRTEGQTEEIAALVDSVRASIDSVAILSNPETIETAMELVDLLSESAASPIPEPVNTSEHSAKPTSDESPTILARLVSIGFQLLVVGLVVLFFLAVGQALTSRRGEGSRG